MFIFSRQTNDITIILWNLVLNQFQENAPLLRSPGPVVHGLTHVMLLYFADLFKILSAYFVHIQPWNFEYSWIYQILNVLQRSWLETIPFENWKDFQMRHCKSVWLKDLAAKLPEVKAGKMFFDSVPFSYVRSVLSQVFHLFGGPQLWLLAVFQPLEPQGCTVSHLKILLKNFKC